MQPDCPNHKEYPDCPYLMPKIENRRGGYVDVVRYYYCISTPCNLKIEKMLEKLLRLAKGEG